MTSGPNTPPSTEPLNASHDDDPAGYDEMRAAGHMARRRLAFYDEVVRGSEGTVVEIGMGTGVLLRELAKRHPDRSFVGVEPLANYVEFARERAAEEGLRNVRAEVGTGEDLVAAVGAGAAGLVISVDMLHHVADVREVADQVARAAAPGCQWRAMEPNRVHPYVLAYHVLTDGERTFPVRPFLRTAAAAGWRLQGRRNLYLYPSTVARVPAWAEKVERRLEGLRPVAGAVVLDLRKVG
ncbi:2-polyprenyl-3-methyl-5-hydroxy-6-metoxy-1,4-benzoquinol methylase [Klenkia marina]|uniref:2-polyprenyl-3-methyl-5-hydroxy-6-metoxy-1,4-benzoquinol methylase n=1 Tax=Klenkia marina TaxID=1960309 RepID=A0A1G4YDT3_9ACTN|nr:class I SAM-dependent methyltransferase [Klenkia marina]SCX51656.1 2-polyprenyl-3-methyl-5-hydroxy-6-metoxy-1,4-benzoquinol methylase [Klenkia marina]